MSTGYQISEQDELYFMTFQIVRWIDIFTRKVYRDIVIDSLRFCEQHKGLEIYAFVIMSNHIHLLARSATGQLSNTVKEFKSFTAKKILEVLHTEVESRKEWILNLLEFSAKQHKRNEKYQLWTHENHAEIVYGNQFMDSKINYIHENPVRAGIVEKAEDYLYSSAGNYAGLDGVLEVTLISRSIERVKQMRSVK
ncbi:MAG: transposase [Dysgonamonadaceae bacterium]|jgi:REP element-mobilizing transposase RayT|nr:transposase [Dysgonamonadaceae bacterium]